MSRDVETEETLRVKLLGCPNNPIFNEGNFVKGNIANSYYNLVIRVLGKGRINDDCFDGIVLKTGERADFIKNGTWTITDKDGN